MTNTALRSTNAFLLLNSQLPFTQVLYSCNTWAVIPALLLLMSFKSPEPLEEH